VGRDADRIAGLVARRAAERAGAATAGRVATAGA